jgi:hypothetical protein
MERKEGKEERSEESLLRFMLCVRTYVWSNDDI